MPTLTRCVLLGFSLLSAGGASAASFDGQRLFERLDQDGNQYLERQELDQAVAKHFQNLDQNADGRVSRSEVEQLRSRIRERINPQKDAGQLGDRVFQRLDSDQDQQVSRDELNAGMEQWVRTLDKDQDGRISREEAKSQLEQLRAQFRPQVAAQ